MKVVQRYGNSPGQKRPQRFIPRKDLFPDETPVLPNKPTPVDKALQSLSYDQPLQSLLNVGDSTFNPLGLFLIVIGGLLLAPRLKEHFKGLNSINIQSVFTDAARNPQYLSLLKDVGPYLEEKEQDIVYTIAGAMELLQGLQELINHTYHNRQQSMVLNVPRDPMAKRIEMMKIIKPYLPEMNRVPLDNVVKAYDAASKLSRNIEIYKNNRVLAADRQVSPVETIHEIIRIIRPVIPSEHLEKADRIMQVVRMAEAMDIAGTSARNTSQQKKAGGKQSSKSSSAEKDTQEKGSSTKAAGQGMEQASKMVDSMKSMLNEEQQETMDVIMQMAQLLSQPAEDEGE